ncbi:hypothetical protein J8247_05395 [Corynebacterium tuberculostearicum]|nr:hypothetical protein J8247_05395 [Corynebacterium tuberculostearicum]
MVPHTTLGPMKRIFQQLLADEEGTFDIETGQQPRTGFAYNPTGVALLKVDEPTPAAIRKALALARQEGARYLGTWRHPDGPLVFLSTAVTQDESVARERVVATGQQAYFDLERCRTIAVPAH